LEAEIFAVVSFVAVFVSVDGRVADARAELDWVTA
jgi:hypothetical protein